MRYYQLSGGYGISVSKEEQEILDAIHNNGKVYVSELAEHMLYVAEQLYAKNAIRMRENNGKPYYFIDSVSSLWRI